MVGYGLGGLTCCELSIERKVEDVKSHEEVRAVTCQKFKWFRHFRQRGATRFLPPIVVIQRRSRFLPRTRQGLQNAPLDDLTSTTGTLLVMEE
jgi:hypothetical protein